MSDLPADALFRTREALERFHVEAGAYMRRQGLLPLIESPAQLEHGDFSREGAPVLQLLTVFYDVLQRPQWDDLERIERP